MRFLSCFARTLTRGFIQTMPIAIAIACTAAVMDARNDRPAATATACAIQTLRSEYRVRGAMADLRDMVRNQIRMEADARDAKAVRAARQAGVEATVWVTSTEWGDR